MLEGGYVRNHTFMIARGRNYGMTCITFGYLRTVYIAETNKLYFRQQRAVNCPKKPAPGCRAFAVSGDMRR